MKKKQLSKLDTEKKKRQLQEIVKYSGLAFQMIAIMLFVLLIGMQADKYLENDFPCFTIFGAFFGVILSLYIVLRGFLKKDG